MIVTNETKQIKVGEQSYSLFVHVGENQKTLQEMEEAVQKLANSYSLSELIYLTQIFFNQNSNL